MPRCHLAKDSPRQFQPTPLCPSRSEQSGLTKMLRHLVAIAATRNSYPGKNAPDLAQAEEIADNTSDGAEPIKAPENCRRMPKSVISSIGETRGYGQDLTSRVSQTQYAANQQTSPATAKQKAGLLLRFLTARRFHPGHDNLEAITSPKLQPVT